MEVGLLVSTSEFTTIILLQVLGAFVTRLPCCSGCQSLFQEEDRFLGMSCISQCKAQKTQPPVEAGNLHLSSFHASSQLSDVVQDITRGGVRYQQGRRMPKNSNTVFCNVLQYSFTLIVFVYVFCFLPYSGPLPPYPTPRRYIPGSSFPSESD